MYVLIIGREGGCVCGIREKRVDNLVLLGPMNDKIVFFEKVGYSLFNLLDIVSEGKYVNAIRGESKEKSNKISCDDISVFRFDKWYDKDYRFFKDDISFMTEMLLENNIAEDEEAFISMGGFLKYLFFKNYRLPSYFPLKEIEKFAYDPSIYTEKEMGFAHISDDFDSTASSVSSAIMGAAHLCKVDADSCVYLLEPSFHIDNCHNATSFTLDLMLSELHYMLSNGYSIKHCKVCGKLFAAANRSDTLYCDRTSPYDNRKTCKEYGAIATYQRNLRENEARGLYRKVYMRLQMNAKRNPDINSYLRKFDDFKKLSKKWKEDLKNGTITEKQYIEWLKTYDKEREKK